MKARLSLKQTIAELLIQLLVKVIYKMKCILSFRNKFKELQVSQLQFNPQAFSDSYQKMKRRKVVRTYWTENEQFKLLLLY